MMADPDNLGPQGEDAAAGYLAARGYRILHRNWRSGKREIDIVAEKNNVIVFIEVKTRSENFLLHPRSSVTGDKQRSVIFAAESYIRKFNINKESRFDIVSVISKNKTVEIEHIEDAFYPTLR